MTSAKLKQFRFLANEIKRKDISETRRAEIAQEITEISKFVDSITDSFARRVFDVKYILPRKDDPHCLRVPTWEYVARQVRASKDWCKHIHSDILSAKN